MLHYLRKNANLTYTLTCLRSASLYFFITFSFNISLCFSANYLPLSDETIDTLQEVNHINSSFNNLYKGKLDLRPKDIIPLLDNIYSLGTTTYRWLNIKVNNIQAANLDCDSNNKIAIDSPTFTLDCTNNRIGINTNSPSHLLDIQNGQMRLINNSNGGLILSTATTGTEWTLYRPNNNTDLRLFISPLDLISFTSNGTIRTRDGTAAVPAYSWLLTDDMGMYRVTSNIIGWSTQGIERMRLDASGNLNIGTTTASAITKLNVQSPIAMRDESTFGFRIQNNNGTDRYSLYLNESDISLRLWNYTQGRDNIIISSSSRRIHLFPVGTPDVELEVSNDATTGGGTIHAASFAAHSSKNLKSDIQYKTEIDENTALLDIKALKPAEFKYLIHESTSSDKLIEDTNGPIRKGLIYEDVPDTLRGPYKTISLNDQIFMLQLALKAAIRRIEQLENKIK